MTDLAISVRKLSKQYRITAGPGHAPYSTLREDLMALPRRAGMAFRKAARGRSKYETVWALDDVSFNVRQGEIVGIIGRNGAGKSTLLKILSRITDPTRGEADIYGRIGTLLEVGTGFHPELTGRENVYLSGAILGMRRQEITQRFDEIVTFAEVEKYIDAPVKRYSSGMYTRLAFSVAAHLDPDILIVDEVLAVGDASFQKKSLAKMKDVGRRGHTVLFVSHNMSMLAPLCDRAVLLNKGRIAAEGPAQAVVSTYLESGLGTTAIREWSDSAEAPGNDVVRLRAVRVRTETGETSDSLDIRRPIGVEMEYDVLQEGHVLVPSLHFNNEVGIDAFLSHDLDPWWRGRPRPVGRFKSTAWIPGNLLGEGTLIVRAGISTHNPLTIHLDQPEAVAFHVVDPFEGDSARGSYDGPFHGVVRPKLEWTNEYSFLEHLDA